MAILPTVKQPKGAAYTFYTTLDTYAAPGVTFVSNPTIAAGDFKVSKDGGAYANLTNLPAAVPASGNTVKIILTAAEMNADNVNIACVDAAGTEWASKFISIQTYLDDTAAYGRVGF